MFNLNLSINPIGRAIVNTSTTSGPAGENLMQLNLIPVQNVRHHLGDVSQMESSTITAKKSSTTTTVELYNNAVMTALASPATLVATTTGATASPVIAVKSESGSSSSEGGSGASSGNGKKGAPAFGKLFKCPECDKCFPHMSALYSHSAMRHHYQALRNLLEPDYNQQKGMCFLCGDGKQLKSFGAYLYHMGGKHKLIHQLMSPAMIAQYSDPEKVDPAQADYLAALCSSSSKTKTVFIPCLMCTVPRRFSTLNEYKQHLSITHLSKQIADKYVYRPEISNLPRTCPFCKDHARPQREYARRNVMVMHLGAKHNCILDFVGETIRKQLHSYGVDRIK